MMSRMILPNFLNPYELVEFIEVLFLVYCIRYRAGMLERLSRDLDEPDYRFDHDFYLSFEDIYYLIYRS
jgi:hypothetical protein